jgi:peptidoglycan/xylan/chitin deacetylase (PgdA/CDA1 family)
LKPVVKKIALRLCALAVALAAICITGRAFYGGGENASGAWAARRDEPVRLPIMMYHSVLDDPRQAGPYTILPSVLEEDLLYLKNNGYETVTPKELFAYVHGGGDLPEKPVMLTFDDGYYNNLIYAQPLLQKYGMRAVISPIGFKVDEFSLATDKNPLYAYLSWDDIRALIESGTFEVGNHSYNLHAKEGGRAGVTRKVGESEAQHRALLIRDVTTMQQKLWGHCAYAPIVFAYPFGEWDAKSQQILREMGFSIFLTCYGHVNAITRDPDTLTRLGRFNRPGDIDTETFMKSALYAGDPGASQ